MLINTDSYEDCNSYLMDNASLFNSSKCKSSGTLIEDIVFEENLNMLQSIFQQHKKLSSKDNHMITSEDDRLINDLEEILSGVWKKPASEEQTDFIKEYFILIKNILDSKISNF